MPCPTCTEPGADASALTSALEDGQFYEYLPSVVAAAALAGARYVLQIAPLWPMELVESTGYEEPVSAVPDTLPGVFALCRPSDLPLTL
eukprot:SAG31_NODE_4530_length_3159_cov_2.970915_3_plen_89_part_01